MSVKSEHPTFLRVFISIKTIEHTEDTAKAGDIENTGKNLTKDMESFLRICDFRTGIIMIVQDRA